MSEYEIAPVPTAYETAVHQAILESIDQALASFAAAIPYTLYYYLERDMQLKREDVPLKPHVFVQGLKLIYGEGAENIEKRIVETLCERFHLDGAMAGSLSLKDCIRQVRHQF